MVYTIAEREFLKSNIPGHFSYEIQSAFEERFGRCLTYAQIKNFKGNNKIWSGVNTTFKKKHVPANKGKKMSTEQYAKCKGTMFKRGHRPQNYRPVGSERINVDGYIEIKVKDPGTWKLKHRVIWEQHNDKIPPDKIVIFKDNNPLNCDIDNLMLVSKSENLRVNAMGGGCYTGQAKETAVAIARLDILISKRRKKRKDGG
jgi:phage protein